MEAGGAKTVWILRRMKRAALSRWAWKQHKPMKARPEELRFDLLGPDERKIGQINCTKFGYKGSTLTTPWGEARIEFVKHGVHILVGDRELTRIGGSLFKKEVDMTFPDGTLMAFKPRKGHKNDIEFSDGRGSVGFFEEKGTFPGDSPGRPLQMTKEEIKRLPKADRPTSLESRDFVQYRVMVWGILPVSQDDLVKALALMACFGCMIEEIPSSG